MKTFLQYIYLEWKRMILSLPKICIGSLLMLLIIAGFLFVCQVSNQEAKKQEPTTIAIVAAEKEPFVDWIIKTISSLEKTKDTFCFKRLSEEEADRQLKAGKLSVIFIIPKDYIASIIDGTNKHVTIRFSKGQTNIVNFLLRQLSEAASSFILNSEAGIYSMQEYYKRFELANAKEDELSLNLQYIKEIAKLNRGVEIEELPVQTSQSYSTEASYLVSAVIIYFFFWGLTCSKMLTTQTTALQNQLWQKGLRFRQQILARGLAFLGVSLIHFLLLFGIASLVMLNTEINWQDTLLSGIGNFWLFALFLLPALLLATAYIQLVYEITEDAFGGILFLFFSVLFMGLFSGCFYPFEYLPRIIQDIGKLLPVYQLCQYSLHALYKQPDMLLLLPILAYSVGFYGFILLIRHLRRIRRDS